MTPPQLADGEVHVVHARLDLEEDALRRFERTLDSGEAARASRFRFPGHRARFIAAHGWLRFLLASWLGAEPLFIRSPYGKPALDGGTLKFNMSHSESLALFAFSREMELGADVEFRRPGFPALENVFAPRERALLSEGEDFFKLWTRKEAYLKAVGKGFSLPPEEIDVASALEEARWSLFEPELGARYAAAVVVAGKPLAVRSYEVTDS